MITRFFSTSKPIHLVIISILVVIMFFATRADGIFNQFTLVNLISVIGIVLVLIASIAVLSFFVTKNHLTEANGFKIMFYGILLAIVPATMTFDKVILANFFLMLALRRIISIRTNLRVKKKLFDAAFWIGIASLFYFWSFLYFGLVLAALLLFSIMDAKNWIIPFLGLATVVILVVTYNLITTDSFGNLWTFIETTSYDYTAYNSLTYIIASTIVLSLGLWATFFYVRTLRDKPKNFRAAHFLILLTVVIAMTIVVIAPIKNGSEFIFLFTPLAIIMTNYIQIVKERWFAEAFVWLLIMTPAVLLIL